MQARLLPPVPGPHQPFAPRLQEYYQHITVHSNPGIRNAREMRTLSLAGDLLLSGQIALCGDALAQRLRALETAQADGSWAAAEQLELLPPTGASSVPEHERRSAVAKATRALRTQRAMDSLRGRAPGSRSPAPPVRR